MKILKKNLLGFAYALPAMLLIAGCGNSADPVFETNEPVELQITPTVALTRGVIAGGAQSGGTGHITDIAVYATGAGTDYGSGNNFAKYSYNSGWKNANTSNKIYLTNAVATLYAYHPASATLTSNTIPVTIKETSAITTAIAAAPDEIDYLYATPATAKNTAASVALTMNHALSMVSFRVYKENYTGTGALTKIVLKNVAGKTALTKGTSNAMNITTGVITQTAPTATATYTRTITGYTLAATSAAANKLSILVLPIATAIPTDEIKAEFTIDGAVYSVSLTDPTDADGWLAGNNNLYSVKLSGTELSISKVEVTAWADKVGGELDIK